MSFGYDTPIVIAGIDVTSLEYYKTAASLRFGILVESSDSRLLSPSADPEVTANPDPLYGVSGCCSSGTSELTASGRVKLTINMIPETGVLTILLDKSNAPASSDPTLYLKVTRVLQDNSEAALGYVTLDSFTIAFTAPQLVGGIVASEWTGRSSDWRESYPQTNRWMECTHASGATKFTHGHHADAFSYWTDSPGACFGGLVCAADSSGWWSRCLSITHTEVTAASEATSVVNRPASDICIKEYGVYCNTTKAGETNSDIDNECCGEYMSCEEQVGETENYTQCTMNELITGIAFVHEALPVDDPLWTHATDGLGQVCDMNQVASCDAAGQAGASNTIVGQRYKPFNAVPFDYAMVFSGIQVTDLYYFPTISSNLKFGFKITSATNTFAEIATGASSDADSWTQAETSLDDSYVLDIGFDRAKGSITLKMTTQIIGFSDHAFTNDVALTVALTIYDVNTGAATIQELEQINLVFVPFAVQGFHRAPPEGIVGTAADLWLTVASQYPSAYVVDGTYLWGAITLDAASGVSGDSITFSLRGEPIGLYTEASTGLIAGSPASTNVTFSMEVVATDLAGHKVVLETVTGATIRFEVDAFSRIDATNDGANATGVLATAGDGYPQAASFYTNFVSRWGELRISIVGVGDISNNMAAHYSFYVEGNYNGCMIDSKSGAVQCAFTTPGPFDMAI